MNWQELITHYGYFAIVVGTFFEGETILVLAGVLAHHGYLNLYGVVGAAFLGTLFGDQLYFLIGRHKGMKWINARPKYKRKVRKIFRLLNRHQILLILGFRFLYGIRTVTPFVLGAAGISPKLYVPLNLLGAGVWAIAVGLLGYWFGQAIQVILEQMHHYEYWFLSILVVFAVVIVLGLYLRRQKR
ncbi:DedA family protein [Celerinatantimonas diazotrophica]|uniref:Membrane protein DedA with SNARE-associated domain n=1 Tax=Celerinatantimonas diazotrophica TaxID=412034 RepID=A0A4R1J8R0_9GAMM|nr:DedA family protein [Celerinatantimonas diazotrophica]TCK46983.1 membrane protein DedA with SNARE-associated domain [Celerinatantimonas diazotrophica]CAG9295751.1 Inner membrane protein YohD [Celerinatantimonas diazotrophica]